MMVKAPLLSPMYRRESRQTVVTSIQMNLHSNGRPDTYHNKRRFSKPNQTYQTRKAQIIRLKEGEKFLLLVLHIIQLISRCYVNKKPIWSIVTKTFDDTLSTVLKKTPFLLSEPTLRTDLTELLEINNTANWRRRLRNGK